MWDKMSMFLGIINYCLFVIVLLVFYEIWKNNVHMYITFFPYDDEICVINRLNLVNSENKC